MLPAAVHAGRCSSRGARAGGRRRGADYARQGAAGRRRRAQAQSGRAGVVFDGVTGGRSRRPLVRAGPRLGLRPGRRRDWPAAGCRLRPGLGARPPGERGGWGRGGGCLAGGGGGLPGAGQNELVGRERVTGALRGGRASLWRPSRLRGRRSPPCWPRPRPLALAAGVCQFPSLSSSASVSLADARRSIS